MALSRQIMGYGGCGIRRGYCRKASAGRRHRRRSRHHVDHRPNLSGNLLMIIVRSPLRITLGGGGTDLPSYYRDHVGMLIAAAVDKYVYITIHQTFIDDLIVKYSALERVGNIDDLKHPI